MPAAGPRGCAETRLVGHVRYRRRNALTGVVSAAVRGWNGTSEPSGPYLNICSSLVTGS